MLWEHEVAGSIPATPTIYSVVTCGKSVVGLPGRAGP